MLNRHDCQLVPHPIPAIEHDSRPLVHLLTQKRKRVEGGEKRFGVEHAQTGPDWRSIDTHSKVIS